ncbi:lysophospholipid acyltransferase family protein [Plastoroseomonas arctica]|uniref:1-acyl-sn-glycerol-3-phosphate acyltransferase n=1 Tax=Plastoroseomonas arctica TaxID=1509237 RepID=A0AAF1JWP3_9PROT|nr:lysophospholipid acyltransferase family protein [Plastoroseomonas arctica]MBR0655516.1 1-acyl-sn-glycerol-3-phosphate acyltransferase [Plastoroseomonas arctica]
MTWQLKPARDLGLPAQERLRSHGREAGLGSVVVHGAWRALVRAHLALLHRYEVTGQENLPEPPFVMVANHSSHLDALCLGAALHGPAARHAHALAAGDTFFTSGATSLFAAYALNALPVWRKRTRAKELETLRTRLIEDELVYILFPEGTRSRDGSMGAFQPGLGAFVAGSAVPVVPCHLQGAFAAWPATRSWPRPGKLRLRIGAPLSFAETAQDRAGWVEVAARCEAEVRALGGKAA